MNEHLYDLGPDNVVFVYEPQRIEQYDRQYVVEQGVCVIEVTSECVTEALALITHPGFSYSRLTRCLIKRYIECRILKGNESEISLRRLKKTVEKRKGSVVIVQPSGDPEHYDPTGEYRDWYHKILASDNEITVLSAADREKGLPVNSVYLATEETSFDMYPTDLTYVIIPFADLYDLSYLHMIRSCVSIKGGEGTFDLWVMRETGVAEFERLCALVSMRDGFDAKRTTYIDSSFRELAAPENETLNGFIVNDVVSMSDIEWVLHRSYRPRFTIEKMAHVSRRRLK